MLLLCWSHRHKYYSISITKWLTIMKYQWIFYFLRRCCLSSITAKTLTGLDCVYDFTPVFGGVRVAHLCSFLCCLIVYIYVLTSLFWCPLRFPHEIVRFYLQLCVGGFMSYLGYVCLFANRVVQHILSVFLLCFSSPCVPYIAIFSGLSIYIAPLVFSNVFFNKNRCSQRPLIVGNPQLIRLLSNHHTWDNWQRNPRFGEKGLLIVTNQNHYVILLISFFDVKQLYRKMFAPIWLLSGYVSIS